MESQRPSGRRTALAAAAALALVALAVAGCGGSSSGSTGGSGSSPPTPGFSKQAKPAAFGEEAKASERNVASQLLERNRSARARSVYAIECETMSAPAAEAIKESGSSATGKEETCAEALEAEAENTPRELLENPLVGPISALRVEGNQGYALWHGKDEKDYAMKMELENGEWKVAATLYEVLPK
jgi:hypothetical protein